MYKMYNMQCCCGNTAPAASVAAVRDLTFPFLRNQAQHFLHPPEYVPAACTSANREYQKMKDHTRAGYSRK